MKRTLMAIGAHADDIELSVGGSLLKYRDAGYEVVYVMSTNNMSGGQSTLKPDGTLDTRRVGPAAQMKKRKSESADGARALGTVPIHLDHPQRHYNGPDGETIELRYGAVLPETVPEDVPSILTAHEDDASRKRLADLILDHDPEWIMTHGAPQQDMEHVGTCLLVTKSYMDARERGFQGGLLHWRSGFAYLGEMNVRWDTHIDISDYMEKKLDLVALHRCQIPDPYRPDFPLRVRNLAWGTASGCRAAEVFVIVQRPVLPKQYEAFSLEIVQHAG